ncbi:MAG: ester cyclase [Pyrinomonadaceae bacterium]
MSAAESKAIARRFIEELWNERRLELADELFAPDAVTHQLRSGAPDVSAPRTPDIIKRHINEWLAAFPDLHFTIEQMLAEADTVVTRCTMSGTHRAAWLGVAPTGQQVSVRMIVTQRIAAGRIAEDWVLVESLGLFQQLGLVPPREELLPAAK